MSKHTLKRVITASYNANNAASVFPQVSYMEIWYRSNCKNICFSPKWNLFIIKRIQQNIRLPSWEATYQKASRAYDEWAKIIILVLHLLSKSKIIQCNFQIRQRRLPVSTNEVIACCSILTGVAITFIDLCLTIIPSESYNKSKQYYYFII